jgi:hypothetical protein
VLVFLSVFFAVLLLCGNPVFGSSGFSSSASARSSAIKTVNLNMTAEITNVASQTWTMSGGKVLTAYILGNQIDPGSGVLSYTMSSYITGNDITGSGTFSFSATINQVPVSVVSNGTLSVNNMNGGLCFPLPKNVSNDCDKPDYLQPSYLNNKSSSGYTSAIPFVFTGPTVFNITIGSETITTTKGFSIEAAGDNLFRGPTILASGDQYVVIVANYTRAAAHFQRIRFRGIVTGYVGNTFVYGSFLEVSDIYENFITGLQLEQGRIILNTSYPALNTVFTVYAETASSYTHYISPLPLQKLLGGGYAHTADCSWATGIEGTCKLAQLTSVGFASAPQIRFDSVFTRVWTIPSAAFEGQLEGEI